MTQPSSMSNLRYLILRGKQKGKRKKKKRKTRPNTKSLPIFHFQWSKQWELVQVYNKKKQTLKPRQPSQFPCRWLYKPCTKWKNSFGTSKIDNFLMTRKRLIKTAVNICSLRLKNQKDCRVLFQNWTIA